MGPLNPNGCRLEALIAPTGQRSDTPGQRPGVWKARFPALKGRDSRPPRKRITPCQDLRFFFGKSIPRALPWAIGSLPRWGDPQALRPASSLSFGAARGRTQLALPSMLLFQKGASCDTDFLFLLIPITRMAALTAQAYVPA